MTWKLRYDHLSCGQLALTLKHSSQESLRAWRVYLNHLCDSQDFSIALVVWTAETMTVDFERYCLIQSSQLTRSQEERASL